MIDYVHITFVRDEKLTTVLDRVPKLSFMPLPFPSVEEVALGKACFDPKNTVNMNCGIRADVQR